ncbi:MAG: DUF4810 domain-containing protein [Gammaproteobacteria bacterium]
MRRERAILAGAAMAAALACGCAQQPLIYRWGVYEELVYEMYAKPGKADPGTQVARLSEDIARTQAEGKRVPPGVHAHLGYMYYLQGNSDAAYQEFATERELFPESATFVDGILRRLGRR